MSRNESNYSLPSANSDAVAGYCGDGGNSSTGENAVGLDVSERGDSYDDEDDDEDDAEDIPHAASMETVPSSNLGSRRKHQYSYAEATSNATTDYYAQESGGLQAIFESRLVPRHRDTRQDGGGQHRPEQAQQPMGMVLEVGDGNGPAANHTYQRTPPTFPDLPVSRSQRRE
jgi:hypothetical protein